MRWIALFVFLVPTSWAYDDGFYVGAEGGIANNDDFVRANDDGSLSMIDDDDIDSSYRAFVGYQFAPHAAVELGYSDHGEMSFTAESDGSGVSWVAGDVGTRFESEGFSASIVGFLPLGVRWSIVGSLGIFAWETTETYTETGFISSEEQSGEDLVFGIGFEADLGREGAWTLRGGTEITEVNDSSNSVQSIRVGAARRF